MAPFRKMQSSLLAAPNLQYTDVFKQEIQIVIKIFQHLCSNTIPSPIPAFVPFLRGEVGVHRPVTGYHKLHSLTLWLRQAGYSQSAVTQTASRSNVLITAASEYICKNKTQYRYALKQYSLHFSVVKWSLFQVPTFKSPFQNPEKCERYCGSITGRCLSFRKFVLNC